VRELSVWLDRALEREASTRSAALLRIALAVLILTRFGNAMMLSHKLDGIGVSLLTLFWLCACAMLLGFRAQLATALMALTLIASAGYMWRVLGLNAWSPHHHGYLMIAATGCCAFTPNGRSYSVDRYLAVRSSERRGTAPPPERGRVGALYLAALQLSAVYFWGAVDKTSIGWLEGAKLESQLLFYVFDSDPPAFAGWNALMLVSAIGTVAFEYALAIGLWIAAARRWLIPLGIVFHIVIYVTFPVTVFSALSCLLYLTYFDPDDVHAVIDRLSGAAHVMSAADVQAAIDREQVGQDDIGARVALDPHLERSAAHERI
jgi:hypothetical protein